MPNASVVYNITCVLWYVKLKQSLFNYWNLFLYYSKLYYDMSLMFKIKFETVMEKYFSKVLPSPLLLVKNDEGSKQDGVKEILTNLLTDPGLRPRILDYHLNIRD